MSKRSTTIDVFAKVAEENPADPADGDAMTTTTTAAADPADAESAGADTADTAAGGETAGGAAEGAAAVSPTATGAAPGARRWLRTALVAAVLVAALGSSAYLGWRVYQFNTTAAAGRAAVDAARSYAEVLTTLDSKDIDTHYNAALDGATGRFKDEYGQGAAQLRQVLVDNAATGRGTVIDAAVKSATRTKVEVLLFVDQSITNAINPSPRIDRNRVQMTMELIDGRWLAANVDII